MNVSNNKLEKPERKYSLHKRTVVKKEESTVNIWVNWT